MAHFLENPASLDYDGMGERAMERLNKFLARAGLGSRRQVEELIRQGRVTVDGAAITELAVKVDPLRADIRCDGERIRPQRTIYYLLNKPRGVVCTCAEDRKRPRAIDLVPARGVRLYTVGRLDADSRGLIVLTNDGALTERLTHPRHKLPKVYRVWVRGAMDGEAISRARRGVFLSEGKMAIRSLRVRRRRRNSTELEIRLHGGANRQIRRVLAKIGHPVTDLRRVAIGPLRDPALPEGAWRRLSPAEVALLRQAGGLDSSRSKPR